MRVTAYISGLILVLTFGACSGDQMYVQRSKSLDSLGGAVNAMRAALMNADTGSLQKAIVKYRYYHQFIQQNVSDTLKKPEADHLQQFFSAGVNLQNFEQNRRTLLERAHLLDTQLSKLSADCKNRSLPIETVARSYRLETAEATQVLEQGSLQQKLFHTSLEDLKNSVHVVEQVIRSRNNGELPKIITDSTGF